MAIMERKMGVWLTLWGIFVALLIQVIYDWGFAFPATTKTAIGFVIACFGLVPLGFYAVNGFNWKKKTEGFKKEGRKRLAVLFRAWTYLKTNKRPIIGNSLFFVLGVGAVIWLNNMAVPELIIILSYFIPVFQITMVGLFAFMFVFVAFLIWAIFRKVNPVWFFVGASLTSLYFAGNSLYEISVLYYANVGWALPDISIEQYSFPAIYIFKLFRSIFFTALFSVIGYWVEILRRKK